MARAAGARAALERAGPDRLPVLGQHDRDGLSDQRRDRMAEDRLRGVVGEHDEVAVVDRQDRVGRRFGQGAETHLAFAKSLLRLAAFAPHLRFPQLALDGDADPLKGVALDAVARAGLERTDGRLLADVVGDDDERKVAFPRLQGGHGGEGSEILALVFGEHDVEGLFVEGRVELLARGDGAGHGLVTRVSQVLEERFRVVRRSIHEEGPQRLRHM